MGTFFLGHPVQRRVILLDMNSNKTKRPSPNHFACEISSSDGSIPGPQLLSIFSCIIFFLLWLPQMSCKIFSFHVLQTCLHLWRLSMLSRPTIIMMSLNIGSGNMSQDIIIFCCIWKCLNKSSNVHSETDQMTGYYNDGSTGCGFTMMWGRHRMPAAVFGNWFCSHPYQSLRRKGIPNPPSGLKLFH